MLQFNQSGSKIRLLCHIVMSASKLFYSVLKSRVSNHFTSFALHNATQNPILEMSVDFLLCNYANVWEFCWRHPPLWLFTYSFITGELYLMSFLFLRKHLYLITGCDVSRDFETEVFDDTKITRTFTLYNILMFEWHTPIPCSCTHKISTMNLKIWKTRHARLSGITCGGGKVISLLRQYVFSW